MAVYLQGVRYFLVLLWVYAALSKLFTFEEFQLQLAQSPLLSAYAVPISYAVILAELGIALLLCVRRSLLTGLYLSFGLMAAFAVYIYLILNYSDFVPCSCGGILEKMGWTEHLWFNLIVCLLILLAIISADASKKRILIASPLLLVGSGAVVFAVAKLSEEKIHYNNALVRKFLHRPLKDPVSYKLDFNSYYIAGITDDSIYLGNTTAARHVLALSLDLQGVTTHRIGIADSLKADYQTAQLAVVDSVFFLTDGTSGIIRSGSRSDWTIGESHVPGTSFTSFIPQSPQRAVLRVYDMEKRETTLAVYDLKSRNLHLQSGILDTNIDGIFDTDGQLLFDADTKKASYVYFYRNSFLVADDKLENAEYHTTIDTVKQVDLEFGYLEGGKQKKLARPYKKVNQSAAAGKGYVMIKSKNLGRFDVADMLEQASFIDVYDTENKSYAFSFYFYHEGKEEVKSYFLYQDKIIGLTENHVVVCEMKKAIFTKL